MSFNIYIHRLPYLQPDIGIADPGMGRSKLRGDGEPRALGGPRASRGETGGKTVQKGQYSAIQ